MGGTPLLTKQKLMRLSHSPDDLSLWGKLGFKAPTTTDDCLMLLEQLLAKREWLKTAPPKQEKLYPSVSDRTQPPEPSASEHQPLSAREAEKRHENGVVLPTGADEMAAAAV